MTTTHYIDISTSRVSSPFTMVNPHQDRDVVKETPQKWTTPLLGWNISKRSLPSIWITGSSLHILNSPFICSQVLLFLTCFKNSKLGSNTKAPGCIIILNAIPEIFQPQRQHKFTTTSSLKKETLYGSFSCYDKDVFYNKLKDCDKSLLYSSWSRTTMS